MTIVKLFPISLICLLLKAEYENSNLDCIRIKQYLSRFDLLARPLVLFWKSSLSFLMKVVKLNSFIIGASQNDGLVLVISVTPVARVAEWRSTLHGLFPRIRDLLIADYLLNNFAGIAIKSMPYLRYKNVKHQLIATSVFTWCLVSYPKYKIKSPLAWDFMSK